MWLILSAFLRNFLGEGGGDVGHKNRKNVGHQGLPEGPRWNGLLMTLINFR